VPVDFFSVFFAAVTRLNLDDRAARNDETFDSSRL